MSQSLFGQTAVPAAVWDLRVRRDDVQRVVDQIVLQDAVVSRAGGERRRRVHLDQPRLEFVVNDDIVTVTLEAVLVVIHDWSHSFEGLDDDPVDLIKQVIGDVPSSGALQIQTQVTDRPLPTVDMIIVVLHTHNMSCTAVLKLSQHSSLAFIQNLRENVQILQYLRNHNHTFICKYTIRTKVLGHTS